VKAVKTAPPEDVADLRLAEFQALVNEDPSAVLRVLASYYGAKQRADKLLEETQDLMVRQKDTIAKLTTRIEDLLDQD